MCGCSEHLGRTIINELYDCDVETMFQLIFTNTDFIKDFFKGEKQFSEWSSQPEVSLLAMHVAVLPTTFGGKSCDFSNKNLEIFQYKHGPM